MNETPEKREAERGKGNERKEDFTYVHPEYITVEEDFEGAEGPQGNFEYLHSLNELKKKTVPLSLRLFLLLVGLAFILPTILLILIYCISGLLNLLTLFSVPTISNYTKRIGLIVAKFLCIILGCVISFFHTPFGVSIVLMYGLLVEGKTNQWFVNRFMKKK